MMNNELRKRSLSSEFFHTYMQVSDHCGDDHGNGMFNAVCRETDACEAAPNKQNKSDRNLQVHQAGKT